MAEQRPNADPLKSHAEAESVRGVRTAKLTKGASILLRDMGCEITTEYILPNGRRVDIIGLDRKGRVIIAEVKSCEADFRRDHKWSLYIDYCDYFYFVTTPDFSSDILPSGHGHIIADAFGAFVRRETRERKLSPSRRKNITLKFARNVAHRLYARLEKR